MKNHSRQNLLESSVLKEIDFNDPCNVSSSVSRADVKRKGNRRPYKDEKSEAEKLLERLKAL